MRDKWRAPRLRQAQSSHVSAGMGIRRTHSWIYPQPDQIGQDWHAHHRAWTPDFGAEHDRHDTRKMSPPRSNRSTTSTEAGAAWCGSPSTIKRRRGAGRNSPTAAANLSVDLQENYRLARVVAPHVDEIRYNPGHLVSPRAANALARQGSHSWPTWPPRTIRHAGRGQLWLGRSGATARQFAAADSIAADARQRLGTLRTARPAWLHALLRVAEGFRSRQRDRGQSAIRRGAARRAVALGRDRGRNAARGHHENPDGLRAAARRTASATRSAFRSPCRRRGSTKKSRRAGRFWPISRPGRLAARRFGRAGLNIISCPSCSRVENEAFVDLAERVREATRYAAEYPITIAVMGCRVNGPGETDACRPGPLVRPDFVNLKRRGTPLGRVFVRRDPAQAEGRARPADRGPRRRGRGVIATAPARLSVHHRQVAWIRAKDCRARRR